MPRNLIFDFDGTLADTLDLAIEFGNANYKRFSKRPIVKEEFRNLSMREALKQIGLPLYRLPQFVVELKQYMKAELSKVELFPGVVEFIRRMGQKHKNLFVMSSNSETNISKVLERHQIREQFSAIHSDSSIFGKSRVLSRMVSRHSLKIEDTLYVGDEVRDYEACKKFGIEMAAVSWGWNSFERLRKAGIPKIASSIAELEAFVA